MYIVENHIKLNLIALNINLLLCDRKKMLPVHENHTKSITVYTYAHPILRLIRVQYTYITID